MDGMQRLDTAPFISTQSGSGFESKKKSRQKKSIFRPSGRRRRAGTAVNPAYAASMLIKICICAGACALVVLLKLAKTPETDKAIETVNQAVTEEPDLSEMLGKLRFVELPAILSVFQQNEKLVMPVSSGTAQLVDDDRMLQILTDGKSEVVAAGSGKVSEIGEDEALGMFVRIRHEGDIESTYFGFREITVEQGQPVKQLDTLGFLNDDGILSVRVLVNGRPENPSEYLDLPEEG